jgi:hypothetical protein
MIDPKRFKGATIRLTGVISQEVTDLGALEVYRLLVERWTRRLEHALLGSSP